MKEIVLISPFEKLKNIAQEVIEENGLEVDVVVGDLREGVVEAKKAVDNGANVIISRGGTYTMIKNSVNIPVVEIKMSSFDILRGFKDLIDYKEKIGVVGYKNTILGCENIREILNLKLEITEISNEEDVYELIRNMINHKVNVFVGDSIGSNTAERLGVRGFRIESGKEAVYDAIQESIRILNVSKKEKEKTERFKTITNFVSDGIVAIDKHGKITLFNSIAEKLFAYSEKNVVGKNISEILKDTSMVEVLKTGKLQIGEVQEVNKHKIAFNRIPILVDNAITGVVATFQDVTHIQDLEHKIRRNLIDKGFTAKYNFEDIIFRSEITKTCIQNAKRYSEFDSPILILGKSGVGKELFAQSIHNKSKRCNGPFVAINCAALPENLIESELFGHVEGSFTGAKKGGKPGLFELAHKGTIFLDEIGELSLEFQARLLRVLQEKKVMRIGDDKVIPLDVRIISATNRNIRAMVEENKFREDLFFRINILTLLIPSLNEREEDILELSQFFLTSYSIKYDKNIYGIEDEAKQYLINYQYKGNIRELEGIIERAVVLCENNKIGLRDIKIQDCYIKDNIVNEEVAEGRLVTLKELEENYINEVISRCKGNLSEASRILGVNRSTLWRKLKSNSV
ncbi:sigma 54-interacting transcriptional regulator [Clostridium sp. DJ247]|uniref:sigma 54-interacting transcriptional regulator n=1 Tax=Clostridium sp. DJ247 TaxID=2726188 RepID=UPI001629D4AA|nr:sigma 54-interacting transcriptional regulator [Clostridium sp. DJ247]MBC2580519.1 sigma 54-interacting transcriptional regulator [Clostridium sp. DJ247]